MTTSQNRRFVQGGNYLTSVVFLTISVVVAFPAMARTIYITRDADGTGDGSSWESPMMLTNYLTVAAKKMADGDRVLLKSGNYVTQIAQQEIKNLNITFAGGYAGTDDTTLDAENPVSVINFGNYPTSRPFTPLKINPGSGDTVSFERIRFWAARSAAINKQGAGTLILSDCTVVSNGYSQAGTATYLSSTVGGRGIHAEGGHFYATNCVFAYNGPYYKLFNNNNYYGDSGFGMWLSGIAAELVDCRFIGNGARITEANNTDDTISVLREGNKRGAAIYATGTTLTAVGCDFIMNKALMGLYNKAAEQARGGGSGGVVVLEGASGGSSFSNCAWIANMNVRSRNYGRYNIDFGGALNVNLSSPAGAVDVANCTFAYNATDSGRASPALDVWKGIVNVRNSVFVGNHKVASGVAGADIMVRTGAVVNVSHTLLPSTDAWNVKAETLGEDAGTLSLGDGVICGDALLASETLASTNLIVNAKVTIQSQANTPVLYYNVNRLDDVLAFDVHPRSKTGRWTASGYARDSEYSPAIDAGDPAASCGEEPKPNGQRLNLGRYGGTAEASLSRRCGLQLMVR